MFAKSEQCIPISKMESFFYQMIASPLRESNWEDGASSIEYAILASLIALVIVSAVGILGINLNSLFQLVVDRYPK